MTVCALVELGLIAPIIVRETADGISLSARLEVERQFAAPEVRAPSPGGTSARLKLRCAGTAVGKLTCRHTPR